MARQEKLLGMIGGLGPLSTIYYYRLLISECRRVCGHAPRMLMYNIPVEEMCSAVRRGDLESISALLIEALRALARGGARVVFISANTPHIAWRDFRLEAEKLGVEAVSIIDATVEHVARLGYSRVAILGSRRLYESGIYQAELRRNGVEVVDLPEDLVREADDLVSIVARGEDKEEHRRRALTLVESVYRLGVDAVILACTELPHLLEGVELSVPIVDTARVQVEEVIRRVAV